LLSFDISIGFIFEGKHITDFSPKESGTQLKFINFQRKRNTINFKEIQKEEEINIMNRISYYRILLKLPTIVSLAHNYVPVKGYI